jgi:hypothetical protein
MRAVRPTERVHDRQACRSGAPCFEDTKAGGGALHGIARAILLSLLIWLAAGVAILV